MSSQFNLQMIENQITRLYKNKAGFCRFSGYRYKDFASKLRTVNRKIAWLNSFLAPLNLEVKIYEKEK